MHELTEELIANRRAVAGYPANSAGIPRIVTGVIDAAATRGATLEELTEDWSEMLDDLIASGH
jgi:hypothetical protein